MGQRIAICLAISIGWGAFVLGVEWLRVKRYKRKHGL